MLAQSIGLPRALAALLTLTAVLWTAALLLIPLGGTDRSSPVLTAITYGAGALVCHQRPERSFHLDGSRLPVCARCTGLYLSGACGALAAWLGASAIPRRTRAVLLAAAVPTALTLTVEWAGVAAPSNLARAIAALSLGGAAGWLFVRMLRAEGSRSHAL